MNLARISIKRPIFLTSIVVLILILGGLSLRGLGVDQFPDVTFPVVVAYTTYSGASPEEVETLVTRPLEEVVSTISGIKRLTSTNQEGLSSVIAEFNLGSDVKYAEQRMRDKISNVRNLLPKEADETIIFTVDISDQRVVQVALVCDF